MLDSLSAPVAVATIRREPGQLVDGRFRIDAQLAEGGMGVVFRAHDERSGTPVALKQIRLQPDLPTKAVAALGVQFEREYHTLSQLAHPCIIEVFDYGVDEGGAYYTMELLRGQDLRQRGKLPWREACLVLRDVASSLAILHSRRLLHRDVTARNVFCIEGGRSKLIDFGAMTTMGVAKHLVGTPPFVPPEALQQQALDGRSDLYSLGALAYWVLTGTYAYSARSLTELKERFATPPPRLHQHDPELPEALDALVMSLLQLDRAARPGTAAEVMERVSGIAGFALEEHAEVSRAYLSMPTLVGRDEGVERIRVELLGGRQGTGTSILIEGPGGSGRSRLLDAGVLHAKLRGAVVVRSDAADAAQGAYGVARALGLQLLEALPSEACNAARDRGDLLAHVLPEVRRSEASTSLRTEQSPERPKLQAALRDFFLSVARHRHVVIAVDDIERADEPSAAVLGALAHSAGRRRLNLLLTVTDDAPNTAALALLREESLALTLQPLDPAQTEQLLRSVFGDVPHVSALAERIHTISAGSPSVTMMLAEHLVEHRIARYEAGSWALPAQLEPDHLPSSASAALLARIASLSPDARDLAEILALTDPEAIAPELFPRLGESGDHARIYRGFEALTATGVLTLVHDRYRFLQFDAGAVIERQMDPSRKRQLHARLAQVLQDGEHPERVAHHLLLGGQEQAGIERILREFATGGAAGARGAKLLQLALEAAERLGLPMRTRLDLRSLMLQSVAQAGQYGVFSAHADTLVRRIELDSGLWDYAQLPDAMDPSTRLREALHRAALRFEATPAHERGFAENEVPLNLFRVYGAFMSMSSISNDLAMIERLPRLEPLIAQSPILEWLRILVEIQLAHRTGRNDKTLALATALTAMTENQGGPAFIVKALRQAMLYLIAQFAATGGEAKTLEYVSELERVPGQRGNAWRVRMVYELMQGNAEAAADCQRRSELLNLQDGGQLQLPGSTLRTELMVHMQSDELMGVKRAMERIAEQAAAYPGWAATLAIARCHYRRLQGDPSGALSELEPALHLRPGRHMDWWLAAYSHIRVLTDLDRLQDAVAFGERYVDAWASEQLSSVDYGLQQATADALVRLGRVQDALEMIERYTAAHERAGTRGLRLGLAYETRARVAIAMRDESAVSTYLQRCAQQFKGGRQTVLRSRFERLMREADAGGIAFTTGFDEMMQSSAHTQTSPTVASRLHACTGSSERFETALRLLLEASGGLTGYLYGLRQGDLVQFAPQTVVAPLGLSDWVKTYIRVELEPDVSTSMQSVHGAEEDSRRFRDDKGREYTPILLRCKRNGSELIGGVAAIQYATSRRGSFARGVLETLTEILIAEGLVEPTTR